MSDQDNKASRYAATIRRYMADREREQRERDRFKDRLYVGDHLGNIYDPVPGIIYARKWNPLLGEYDTFVRVEVPEQYQNVTWFYGDIIEVQTDRDPVLFLRKVAP